MLNPEVNVSFYNLYEINWLMGGEYRLVNVSAPVRFHGKKREVDGSYTLVIWENLTEPILGGREESGMPKIYADIAPLQVLPPRYATAASSGGATFLTMYAEMEAEVTGSDFDATKAAMSTVNALGWRYIPKLSGIGADLDQFVLYPQGMGVDQLLVGKGSLTWTKPGPLQNYGQRHIIHALADLPVLSVKPVLLAKGTTMLDPLGGSLLV